MDTISQLQQDIERYDADALYYIGRAEHCRHEAALLRRELAQEQLRKDWTRLTRSPPPSLSWMA
jgi:hypothetical protein